MNKKNIMNMWSVGLGSVALMIMLANHGHIDVLDGQTRSNNSASAGRTHAATQLAEQGAAASRQENSILTPEMMNQFLKIVSET
ncbi:hypothetical protein AMS62_24180 [Bacillus sp. FJAT-18019]|nr:hypothetical protein AMS62_24180 [Bacillus sp. FJAT-18019]